ncbi:MAG: hypothetical protein LQ345_003134, partial [Seirophora villosa]
MTFDRSRLDKTNYNDRDPIHISRFQSTVEDFTTRARTNQLLWDRELLHDFCAFVEDRRVWHHAQMVVPEFRSIRPQQSPGGTGPIDYILSQLQSLPQPVPERDLLTTEQDLLMQRHKNWLTCIRAVTEGRFRESRKDPELEAELKESEAVIQLARTSKRGAPKHEEALQAEPVNTKPRQRLTKSERIAKENEALHPWLRHAFAMERHPITPEESKKQIKENPLTKAGE